MNNLVERLTDSARQKQLYVMRVQQRQIAEEVCSTLLCFALSWSAPRDNNCAFRS
jgi:hypothetical protein